MSHNPNPNNFGSGGRYGPPQSYGPPRQMYGQPTPQNYSVPSSHNPYAQHRPAPVAYGNKSIVLAYVCWFLLGGLGLHKFYLEQWKLGFAYLTFTIVGSFCTFFFGVGGPFGFVILVALIIDLFTIPKRVAAVNSGMADDNFNLTG